MSSEAIPARALFVGDGEAQSVRDAPVTAAIRGHFFHEERLLDRRIRSHFRRVLRAEVVVRAGTSSEGA